MTLTYKNFIIKPCVHAPAQFDVVQKIKRRRVGSGTIHDPQGEEYEVDREVVYGVRLERALHIIIDLSIDQEKEELTIKEYLEEFSKRKEELLIIANKFKN